jgi:Uma2 family endonuclease
MTPTVLPPPALPSARPIPVPIPAPASRPVPLIPWRPQTKKWTCKEFHQLGDMGWFEGKRAILINGEILEMPGPKPPHAMSVVLVETALRAAFGPGFFVRPQLPLVLGQSTDPEPDAAVIEGSPRDFPIDHPTTAALAAEISDTTLSFDLGEKASLYAAGGIADYWVVDLNNRQLIVHRNPVRDPNQLHGWAYADVTAHAPGTIVNPPAAPTASVAVADLLP